MNNNLHNWHNQMLYDYHLAYNNIMTNSDKQPFSTVIFLDWFLSSPHNAMYNCQTNEFFHVYFICIVMEKNQKYTIILADWMNWMNQCSLLSRPASIVIIHRYVNNNR